MKKHQVSRSVAVLTAALAAGSLFLTARTPEAIVPVRMTVTLDVQEGKRAPEINREDIIVKQGQVPLSVTDWVAARSDQAGLEPFILIDDASQPGLGIQFNDLRSFINAQGPGTSVGIVQIVQNFTLDHAAAAKAVRLPLGSPGAYGSPYLSLTDLMKRRPHSLNRREVILIADGNDRSLRGFHYRGLGPVSPDVDVASTAAQRNGAIIHTFPGVGRLHRNFCEATNG